MEMHLFNQLITDHLLYIPVKINKVLYQKSILNFLTFNTLSILFINNIIDIINNTNTLNNTLGVWSLKYLPAFNSIESGKCTLFCYICYILPITI